jgi:hypothetical protein
MLTATLITVLILLAVIAYTLRQIRKIVWEQAHDVEKILGHIDQARSQSNKK